MPLKHLRQWHALKGKLWDVILISYSLVNIHKRLLPRVLWQGTAQMKVGLNSYSFTSFLPLWFLFSHVLLEKSVLLSVLLTIRKLEKTMEHYYRGLFESPHKFKMVSYLKKKKKTNFLLSKLPQWSCPCFCRVLKCCHSLSWACVHV